MTGLDFSRITTSSTSDSATEPRRIFSALPSKVSKYSYPRDVQSEVWESWHLRREERDLVIKMNTGSGKTVVGLVALKSCLNEGVGPATYIAPDIPLSNQVAEEAQRLGLEVTDDPRSPRFLQGHAILVANVYKLFNGLSVFGVKGGSRQPIELGAVLIDDAHACLATIDEQYTLTIPREHPGYEELFALFSEDLQAQSQPGYLDLEAGGPGVVLPIPFWSWSDKQKQVVSILHPHREDGELLFNWPLLVDVLPICRAAISAESIEIAPACPPIETIPSFDRARRRLYLTATLSDDSVLVTHLGADSKSVQAPINPRSANDLGDRMILTPEQTFPACDEDLIRDFVAEYAETLNVVVIVPSWARAETWSDRAQAIHGADTLQDGLAELRSGHVGLVVLVNKYDGIDLPGDACHFLVLDGLPEAIGTLDRLGLQVLEGSDALLGRQVQRIEQGMGRGVRSNDDYCVVLLLGKRLTARLYPPQARDKFSPATRAQLNLSDEVGGLLEGRPFEELGGVVDQCISRDPGWITASRNALDGVVYPRESSITSFARSRREAFDLACADRCREAAASLQEAIDELGERRLRGLLKEEAAAYVHRHDPVAAQQLQVSAYSDNRGLTRPNVGISYVPLRASAPQAQAAADFLGRTYKTGPDLLLGVGSLLEQLVPETDPASVPRFEAAMRDLAGHLGLAGQRPERELGRGPDVLWLLGEHEYFVIECKSGSQQDVVFKTDMSQLSHSMDWFAETYDATSKAIPVLIHPSRTLDSKASARPNTRVLTFTKLGELRDAVRTFATAIASNDLSADSTALWDRLTALHLNAAAFANHWTVKPRKAK